MFSKTFWSDTLERVIATISQTLLALLTVDGTSAVKIDLQHALLASLLAGIISLLKCIVALKTGGNSASFTVENVKEKGTL